MFSGNSVQGWWDTLPAQSKLRLSAECAYELSPHDHGKDRTHWNWAILSKYVHFKKKFFISVEEIWCDCTLIDSLTSFCFRSPIVGSERLELNWMRTNICYYTRVYLPVLIVISLALRWFHIIRSMGGFFLVPISFRLLWRCITLLSTCYICGFLSRSLPARAKGPTAQI